MMPLRAHPLIRSCAQVLCLLLGLAVLTSRAQAAANYNGETPHRKHSTLAVHGMVLFGNQRLYASHLGLYHHPHDRQIVLPIRFSKPEQADSYARWRTDNPGLVTLAPRPFELANLAPDAKTFEHTIVVDIYRGHFERGGEKVFSQIAMQLDKPLIYQVLSPGGNRAAQASFWLLPDGDSDFLVYQIGPRPDQDLIAEVTAGGLCHQPVCVVSTPLAPGAEFVLPNDVQLINHHTGQSATVRQKKSVYREHTDFSF